MELVISQNDVFIGRTLVWAFQDSVSSCSLSLSNTPDSEFPVLFCFFPRSLQKPRVGEKLLEVLLSSCEKALIPEPRIYHICPL